MVDTNALAAYIEQNANSLAQERNSLGKDSAVPKKPPKGQVIHCFWCGKPMYPEDFSKDPYKRKKEFKWQTHWDCMQTMQNMCDQGTKGLIEERKQRGYNLGKAGIYFADPDSVSDPAAKQKIMERSWVYQQKVKEKNNKQ